MKLADLRENPENPSKATEEQLDRLAGKLKRVPLGLTAMRIAYVTDDPAGGKMVISGNKRLRVLKKAYGDDADLPDEWFQDVTGMSPAERHEFIVTANVSDGGWDFERLLQQYDSAELGDFMGQDLLDELVERNRKVEMKSYMLDEDKTPEPDETYDSRPGKTYRLGRHLLICGDATKTETVDALLGNGKADLVVTDPPYNINIEGKTKEHLKIKNDSMTNEEFMDFLRPVFKNIEYALKPGGVFYVWQSDGGPDGEFEMALREANLHESMPLVWVKHTHSFSMGHLDYNRRHEACKYGWKTGAAHFFTPDNTLDTLIRDDTPDFSKMKKEELAEMLKKIYDESSSVLTAKKPARNALHPTMKPVMLIKQLILNSSRPGEIVLDLFLGSGTTVIACEETARRCVGVELDPKYCDVIRKRWAEFVHGEGCDWKGLTPEAED